MPAFAAGAYDLFVEKPRFRKLFEPGVVLQVDQQARLDLRRGIGDVAESIEVRAEAPLLNTENAAREEVVASVEISEMPLDGRDFSDLTDMVPGVARKAHGGSSSARNINGARSDNINFLIDGFTNSNMRGGGAQARPPVDALQGCEL